MKLKRFNRIKQRLESLQTKTSKLEGALESNISRLTEEFDCSTVEEGKKLREQLKNKKKKLKTLIEKKMSAFEKKWGSFFDDKNPTDENGTEPITF